MYIIKYLMCITIISNYWEVSNIGSKCIFILSVLWVLSTSLRETKARNLGHLAINSIQRKETKFEKEKKETKQEKLPQKRAVVDGTTCKSSKVVSYQPWEPGLFCPTLIIPLVSLAAFFIFYFLFWMT